MASTKQVKFEKNEPALPQPQAAGDEKVAVDAVSDKTVAGSTADQKDRPSKKEHRKRMKGLLSAVKKQMEFYFGDANINKDRFMKQFVDSSPDGYLPISLFLTFHKIQKLTDSQDVIARALQKSDLLKVSEDRTKVCRTRPVHYMTQEEVDARTVYVEGLPKHADHDWVSSQFASCGRVAYVSLPRYRQTGDIKGFAFVEFETPEEAAKAVEMMNKVPEDVEEGEKLSQSVKTLKNLKYWRNRALKEGIDPDKEVVENQSAETSQDKSEKKPNKKAKKRKRRTSEQVTEENEQAAKKAKLNTADSETKSSQLPPKCVEGKDAAVSVSKDELPSDVSKKTKSDSERNSSATETEGQRETAKRKRRSESSAAKQAEEVATKMPKTTSESNTKPDGDTSKKAVKREADSSTTDQDPKKKKQKAKQTVPGKQSVDQKDTKDTGEAKKRKRKILDKGDVMSKAEWTQLKREYLNQQRASMANLKQQLKSRQTNVSHPAAQPIQADEQPHQDRDGKQAPCSTIRSAPEFVPGVIVEIKSEAGMFYKQLKEQIDPSISVAYVDVKDNQLSGHIRCKDADSARRLASADIPRCTLTLVQGDAEKAYWEKMVRDRESKLSNTKRRKKRGSTKLLEKAQNATMESMQKNHIMFDED
ncbi:hypothetical protein BaRGS_00010214 [Batillaria attramentaria]|uniref:La-related protein 7 n=1 Tax=Batillaria attramentaria TaxID=370345 RepID=A0ABD0LG18_9CAEN